MSGNLTPSQKGQASALPKVSTEMAIVPKKQNPDIIHVSATEVKSVQQVFSRMQELLRLQEVHKKATERVNELDEFNRIISDESGFTLTAFHLQSNCKLEFTHLKGNTDFVKLQLETGKKYLAEIEYSIQNFVI